MLNISKYHQAIVGCSAIATAALAGFVQSAQAAERFQPQTASVAQGTILIAQTNLSNSTGTNVSNTTGTNVSNTTGTNFQPGSLGGYSPAASAQATKALSSLSFAQSKYDTAAAALAKAETAQPTASDTSPVRYGREPGDLASCGCPNTDVTTKPGDRPELVAARAAEAQAAAELAAAKAEARQVIESAKSGNTANGSVTFSPLW
jgi:hypothetical protein